jgi:hypothetical protein
MRDQEAPMSARVPADVERPDVLVFGLTARQVAILAGVGVLLWLGFQTTHSLVPPLVFLAGAVPIAGTALAVVLVRRDGMSLDRLLVAAWRQHRSPRRLVPADGNDSTRLRGTPAWVAASAGPLPAPLHLPAQAISGDGVVDLGADGASLLSACSTVNFGLRTPGEQNALVAGFARWLHSLTGPVQIVIRADRLDLHPVIDTLEQGAGGLPHPALEDACRAHAAFLADLAATRDLLRRQVTLVHHQPTGPGRADSAGVVARRATDATRGLGACEVTVAALDGGQAHAVLAAAADPHGTPAARRAETAGVVTARADLTDALTSSDSLNREG